MKNLLLILSMLIAPTLAFSFSSSSSSSSISAPYFYCTPADIIPGLCDAGVSSMKINENEAEITFITIAGPRPKSFTVVEHKVIHGFAGPIYFYTLDNGAEVVINQIIASRPVISARLTDKDSSISSARFKNCTIVK
ncbi:MAG: hypothetical protein HQK51_16905 [Oligoflexia bacterium]|nr:hypothetical protein [Oligoflexia bacterium]